MISNKRRSTEFISRRIKRKQAKLEQKKVEAAEEMENEEDTGDGEERDEIDEEEQELESFLFGKIADCALPDDKDAKSFLDGEVEDVEDDDTTNLLAFEISTKPSGGNTVDFLIDTKGSGGQIESGPIQLGTTTIKPKPAWVDPDDDEVTIDIAGNQNLRKLREDDVERSVSGTKFQERLKTNFEKVLPAPSWADLDKAQPESDSDEEEERIFKSRKKLLSKPDNLPKGLINIKRLKDINKAKPSNTVIKSLKFHPSAKIALTASLDKNLNIFQVDGKANKKLKNIFLTNFPIWCADFTSSGEKIICSSKRRHFYVYDMIEGSVVQIPRIRGRDEKSLKKFVLSPNGDLIAFIGDSGYVNLVSMKTMQWISSLKMNGSAHTASFSPDSSKIYTTGRDGEVYVWDVNTRRCLHRFLDDGSLHTTSIGVSTNGSYMALGSTSGVVNIYDDNCFTTKSPTPLKSMMNLTTRVDGTVFNPAGEMLACFSPQQRNALKLLHFPSLTVFSNWPIEKQTLGNVTCVDFSPKNGYMGVGNEAGKALLFRLRHYPDS